METVFLAMSGGMDSAFAAYLLRKKGYKVQAFTFKLFDEKVNGFKNDVSCSSYANIQKAKKIAESLSIPHHVMDLSQEFKDYVIERFIEAYGEGKTPNPCVLCNKHIKFSIFLERSLEMGANKVATGHYASIEEKEGQWVLKKGNDKKKDQSYFLYPIKKDYLKYIFFPLGSYTKDRTREEIQALIKGEWSESQDICFLGKLALKNFLAKFLNPRKGPVYHADGTFMGFHEGICFYTIGQRRGLNIPYKYPLYVIYINAEENAIFVGPKELLQSYTVSAEDINIISPLKESIKGKIRYKSKEEACEYSIEEDRLFVKFRNPVEAVARGQSVVLYSDEIVVGGGVII